MSIACSDVLALPDGSVPFDPPPEYRLWWSMVESCSGLRGSLDDVSFFTIPGAVEIPGDPRRIDGEWNVQGNRIVLAGRYQYTGSVVRHEMLHALVRAFKHPRLEFVERCGGIVACVSICLTDDRPPPTPPAGTPLVDPGALEIGVEIEPAAPSKADFDGYFSIIVTARNTATHDVVVNLTPFPEQPDTIPIINPSLSFAFLLFDDAHQIVDGGTDLIYDSETTFFKAGETKREAFDLYVGSRMDGGLPPGNYVAHATFGGKGDGQLAFTLSQ